MCAHNFWKVFIVIFHKRLWIVWGEMSVYSNWKRSLCFCDSLMVVWGYIRLFCVWITLILTQNRLSNSERIQTTTVKDLMLYLQYIVHLVWFFLDFKLFSLYYVFVFKGWMNNIFMMVSNCSFANWIYVKENSVGYCWIISSLKCSGLYALQLTNSLWINKWSWKTNLVSSCKPC